jgi:hypothetical protein
MKYGAGSQNIPAFHPIWQTPRAVIQRHRPRACGLPVSAAANILTLFSGIVSWVTERRRSMLASGGRPVQSMNPLLHLGYLATRSLCALLPAILETVPGT